MSANYAVNQIQPNPISAFTIGSTWLTDTQLEVTVERISTPKHSEATILFLTSTDRSILRTITQAQKFTFLCE
jgi:hypothetical protein